MAQIGWKICQRQNRNISPYNRNFVVRLKNLITIKSEWLKALLHTTQITHKMVTHLRLPHPETSCTCPWWLACVRSVRPARAVDGGRSAGLSLRCPQPRRKSTVSGTSAEKRRVDKIVWLCVFERKKKRKEKFKPDIFLIWNCDKSI